MSSLPWLPMAIFLVCFFAVGSRWPWDIKDTAVGKGCLARLYYMQAGKSDDPYTLPMLFASGKDLPYDAGKYDLCVQIPTARYFLVSLLLSNVKASFPGLGIGGMIPIELGLCLPDVCTPEDIGQLVTEIWADSPPFPLPRKVKQIRDFGHVKVRSVTSPDVGREDPTSSTYIAIIFAGCLVLLVSVATAVHEYSERRILISVQEDFNENMDENMEGLALNRPEEQRHDLPVMKNRAVQAFSLQVSWRKLMAPSPKQAKETDHLNGIRVISMCWIVMGHTFLMANGIAGYDNPEEVIARNTGRACDVSFQVVLGGHAAVDTFFYISGFLLAYLTVKERKKHLNCKQILLSILYRYLRLTPSLAFVLLLYYRVSMYVGDGPFFPRYQNSVTRRCNGTWITELLYSMNFWPWDPDAVCMGWTWYLGCDFIFYIITLIVLVIYSWRSWVGWLIIICCVVGSVLYTAKDVWIHRLGVYLFEGVYEKYSYHAYSRPWNRFPGYLIGVISALLYAEYGEKRLASAPGTLMLLLNFLGLLLMLFVVIIPWTTFKWPNSWSRLQNVAYISLGRPAWALGLSVVSVTCLSCSTPCLADLTFADLDTSPGFLGRRNLQQAPQYVVSLINRMLSSQFWVPLARLTYSCYLVHPVIIKYLAANSDTYYHFSYTGILERTVANCILSYCVAFVLYMLVERPVLSLMTGLLK